MLHISVSYSLSHTLSYSKVSPTFISSGPWRGVLLVRTLLTFSCLLPYILTAEISRGYRKVQIRRTDWKR